MLSRMLNKKTLVALIVSLSMVLTLFPTFAFANGEGNTQGAEQASSSDVYKTDRVIVVFNDNVSEDKADSVVEENNDNVKEITETSANETVAVVNVNDQKTVDEAIEEYEDDPVVDYVAPDYFYEATETNSEALATMNDTYYSQQYYLNSVNSTSAWKYLDNANHSKVKVAVLDTGADVNHPDLQTSLNKNLSVDVSGESTVALNNDINVEGHGTHVAGIISGTSNNAKGISGVASGKNNDIVELMAIKVFETSGGAYTSDIVKGMDYAVNNGAKVINMSLGTNYGDRYLKAATERAAAADVVMVCAAGNEGSAISMYPADFSDCISVIATDKYNKKANYSNYGNTKTISAPGNSIYSTLKNGTYGTLSGTSMASPIVAAVAAMVRSANPSLSATQVRDILTSTATDLYTKGYDSNSGNGLVNAGAAVAKALGVSDESSSANVSSGVNESSNVEKLTAPKITSATAYGGSAAKISWNQVSNATKYYVYRYTSKGYVHVGTTTSNYYTDKSRSYGKTYRYRVVAANSDGRATSDRSGYKNVTIKLKTPGFSVKKYSSRTAMLTWSKSSGADGYFIYRATKKYGKYKKVGCTRNTYYKNYSLSKRGYYYKVYAYDKVGSKVCKSSCLKKYVRI